jgi:hypothetical protein
MGLVAVVFLTLNGFSLALIPHYRLGSNVQHLEIAFFRSLNFNLASVQSSRLLYQLAEKPLVNLASTPMVTSPSPAPSPVTFITEISSLNCNRCVPLLLHVSCAYSAREEA